MELAGYDARLLWQLKSMGWSVWDPTAVTDQAHEVCTLVFKGASPDWIVGQLSGPGSHTTAARGADLCVDGDLPKLPMTHET